MTATISISQIWFNKSLADFFFDTQAYTTLEELVARSTMSEKQTLVALEIHTTGMSIDEVADMFRHETVEYCAHELGIELEEDEEGEEEE